MDHYGNLDNLRTREVRPTPQYSDNSTLQRNRQEMIRREALDIAYAFLGPAGSTFKSQWPSHSERMSPEIYHQVIAEFEAHGKISGKAKEESNLARRVFEGTYSNIGRGPDHLYVQPNVHEAHGYPGANPHLETQFVPQHTSRDWPQFSQQARPPEAFLGYSDPSGSGIQLDALSSDRAREIPLQQSQLAQELSRSGERYKTGSIDQQERFNLRITPNRERLTEAEKNAVGIYLWSRSNLNFEVYIPWDVITANNYTHQVSTRDMLNQYAPNSIGSMQQMTRLFSDVAYNRNRDSVGMWVVKTVRPQPQGQHG